MIIGCVVVMMEHSHKRGQQENQYKKNCKTFARSHIVPFTPEDRLSSADDFVKKLLVQKDGVGGVGFYDK